MRLSSCSGSKVITDPGKLGPDLLELLVERNRRCVVCHVDARDYAPWQRLYFLPLPHQHGSLRPIFSRSLVTRCWVMTEPPPASSEPAVTPEPSPSAIPAAAPPPAAAIACAPASDSCS